MYRDSIKKTNVESVHRLNISPYRVTPKVHRRSMVALQCTPTRPWRGGSQERVGPSVSSKRALTFGSQERVGPSTFAQAKLVITKGQFVKT